LSILNAPAGKSWQFPQFLGLTGYRKLKKIEVGPRQPIEMVVF
jgi:hypothetical protein